MKAHYQLFITSAYLKDGQNLIFSIKIAFSCAYFLYKHMRIQQYARRRQKIQKSSCFVLPTASRQLVVLKNKKQISKAQTFANKTLIKSDIFYLK